MNKEHKQLILGIIRAAEATAFAFSSDSARSNPAVARAFREFADVLQGAVDSVDEVDDNTFMTSDSP